MLLRGDFIGKRLLPYCRHRYPLPSHVARQSAPLICSECMLRASFRHTLCDAVNYMIRLQCCLIGGINCWRSRGQAKEMPHPVGWVVPPLPGERHGGGLRRRRWEFCAQTVPGEFLDWREFNNLAVLLRWT